MHRYLKQPPHRPGEDARVIAATVPAGLRPETETAIARIDGF